MRNNPVPRDLFIKRSNKTRMEYDRATSMRSALGNRKLQIVRRKNIAMCKVLGMSNKHIGEIFNIGRDRVSRELKFADQEGLLDRLNAQILDELVPEAIRVYKDKMTKENDAFVAKDVLKHLDRLTARIDAKEAASNPTYSVQAYIQAKNPEQLGPNSEINLKQIIKGEQAKQLLEQTTMEPAEQDDILSGVVVEKKYDG